MHLTSYNKISMWRIKKVTPRKISTLHTCEHCDIKYKYQWLSSYWELHCSNIKFLTPLSCTCIQSVGVSTNCTQRDTNAQLRFRGYMTQSSLADRILPDYTTHYSSESVRLHLNDKATKQWSISTTIKLYLHLINYRFGYQNPIKPLNVLSSFQSSNINFQLVL